MNYEKLTEVEKNCFLFFRNTEHDLWTVIEYGIKKFNQLGEKRVRELAKAADPDGYRQILKRA